MSTFSKILMGSAIASLAFSQPAFAGTRAADSITVLTGERASAPVSDDSERVEGVSPVIFFAAAAVIGGLFIWFVTDDDEDISPGT